MINKNRLKFLFDTELRQNGSVLSKYKCNCGKIIIKKKYLVIQNKIKSCGCIYHGMQGTKEYKAWIGMKERCYCKTNKDYHRYGGKGVKVYKHWINNFKLFYKYIGDAPTKKHSIDRINTRGNYVPGNIRWATIKQQNRNKSNGFIWFINGFEFETCTDAAVFFNVQQSVIDKWVNGSFNYKNGNFYPPKKNCFKKARY